jgi:hypothetical protein
MRALPLRYGAWLALLPSLLVLVVWLPVLGASFQFDDWAAIVADPRLQSLASWWHSMPGVRPLLTLSYALNHELGASPGVFRAVNIGLHGFNAALLFLLLRRVARRWRLTDAAGANFTAAVASLLFALHPVQTESVTHISGRSTVLMGSWVLLSLLAYTHRRGGQRPWYGQLLTLACVAAALATQESAAVAPLALMLVVCREHGQRLRATLAGAAPALLLVLLLLGVHLLWLPYDSLLQRGLELRGLAGDVAAQIHGIGWLVGQLLRMDLLNADPAMPAGQLPAAVTVCTGAALAAVLLLGLAGLRRWPGLAFGILWFYLWLAPSNSLLAGLDVPNDRQLYLAIIGPAWLAGLALLRLPAWLRAQQPNAAYGLLVVLAVALAAGTLTRNRVYATPVSFWQDVVEKSPDNVGALNNLGRAHALACEPLAARSAFERALWLAPQDPRAALNLALLLQGKLAGQPAAPACR